MSRFRATTRPRRADRPAAQRRRTVPLLLLAIFLLAVASVPAPPAVAEGPPRLDPPAVELEGRFEGVSSREVYQAVADQAGLSITYDPGLKHREVSLDLAGLGVGEALQHVATVAGHFLAPVAERSLLVVADTPQNRRAHESIGIRTFELQHARVPDVMTALRSLLDARRLSATEDPPQVTMRDVYPKLAIASRLVERLDRRPWEVRLHLELLPIPAEVVTEVAQAGGELSGETERRVRSRAGKPLAVGTLGLVGTEAGEWKLFNESSGGDGEGGQDRLVALSARSRVSGDERPVHLELEMSVLSPGASRGQGLRQRSSFQVADGATVALPILHRGADAEEPAASALLLVTPKLVAPGRLAAQTAETLYLGSEGALTVAHGE